MICKSCKRKGNGLVLIDGLCHSCTYAELEQVKSERDVLIVKSQIENLQDLAELAIAENEGRVIDDLTYDVLCIIHDRDERNTGCLVCALCRQIGVYNHKELLQNKFPHSPDCKIVEIVKLLDGV